MPLPNIGLYTKRLMPGIKEQILTNTFCVMQDESLTKSIGQYRWFPLLVVFVALPHSSLTSSGLRNLASWFSIWLRFAFKPRWCCPNTLSLMQANPSDIFHVTFPCCYTNSSLHGFSEVTPCCNHTFKSSSPQSGTGPFTHCDMTTTESKHAGKTTVLCSVNTSFLKHTLKSEPLGSSWNAISSEERQPEIGWVNSDLMVWPPASYSQINSNGHSRPSSL